MNICIREWKFYRKQTIFWCMGLLLMIFISFYKVDGLTSVNGGMEAMLKTLPPALQVLFSFGATDYSTASGSYSMIHLYLAIALALHAVILGAGIFEKEERDKTYEFLYVKGVKRWKILSIKIMAGLGILVLLDIICLIGVYASVILMDKTFILMDMLPFMVSLFVGQSFFFALALLLVFLLPNANKAGMIGCCIVFAMFLISMYVKMGGGVEMLERFSIFHYLDAAYVQTNGYGGMSTLFILFWMVLGCAGSIALHNRRDLL